MEGNEYFIAFLIGVVSPFLLAVVLDGLTWLWRRLRRLHRDI